MRSGTTDLGMDRCCVVRKTDAPLASGVIIPGGRPRTDADMYPPPEVDGVMDVEEEEEEEGEEEEEEEEMLVVEKEDGAMDDGGGGGAEGQDDSFGARSTKGDLIMSSSWSWSMVVSLVPMSIAMLCSTCSSALGSIFCFLYQKLSEELKVGTPGQVSIPGTISLFKLSLRF